jgi:phosphoribosylamine--glycine ligase
VVLPRLTTDLTDLLAAAAAGDRGIGEGARFAEGAAVGVVIATHDYPAAPRTGDLVEGLDEAGSVKGVTVFHAGTSRDPSGALRTAGGRALVVTALGDSLAEARGRAYEGVAKVGFDGMQYRLDIAASIGAAAT